MNVRWIRLVVNLLVELVMTFERVERSIDRSFIGNGRSGARSRGRMSLSSGPSLMRGRSSSEELLDGRSDSTSRATSVFGLSVRSRSGSSGCGSCRSRSFGVMRVIGGAEGNKMRIDREDQNEGVLMGFV